MKKLTGWLIIIFCSFLLLIFLFVIIIIAVDPYKHSDPKFASTVSALSTSTIIGYTVFIFFSILGIRYGIKRIKNQKVVERIPYHEKLEINFTGQINYKNYRNLMFALNFKKPFYFVAVGLLFYYIL